MAPPSLPRPSEDRGPDRVPRAQAPSLLSAAPPVHRPADTEAPPCRTPDGGQSLCRLPAPAGIPGPGGEHTGRLPGPDGPDRFTSGAHLPGTAAFDLPALPSAVGTARHVVRDLLTAWGLPGDARDDVVLVVSELVTNALVHSAGRRIGCRLRSTADRIRVEVEDQAGGPALPVARRPGPDDPHGRGLLLVGTLSRDWGVTAVPGGGSRVVWAELPAGPA
ncbi:ATP-binding protein [Streptomyces sp. NPDC100445]|uniref:ATP-binding protein n=1 Tax=Streptomyces sp. NPDC100445 TaxID=3366102 RepID=UPI003823D94F